MFLLLSNLTGGAWIRRRVPQKCCSVASGLLKLCALNCWDERTQWTMRQWQSCEGLRRVEKFSEGFSFFGWCELCTRLRWYRVFSRRSCNLWVVGAAPLSMLSYQETRAPDNKWNGYCTAGVSVLDKWTTVCVCAPSLCAPSVCVLRECVCSECACSGCVGAAVSVMHFISSAET